MYERFISSSMLTGCWAGMRSAICSLQRSEVRVQGAESGRGTGTQESGQRFFRFLVPDLRPLHIKVFDIQRVVFDELAARFDLIAHERREHQIRFRMVLGAHLKQRS